MYPVCGWIELEDFDFVFVVLILVCISLLVNSIVTIHVPLVVTHTGFKSDRKLPKLAVNRIS